MSSVRAVSMIMGTSENSRMVRQAVSPSISGIMMSSTMSRMSGSRASSMASRPLLPVTT